MANVILYAFYSRVFLAVFLGILTIISIIKATAILKIAASAKTSKLKVKIFNLIEGEAGTIVGSFLLVSIVMASATYRAIPDLSFPDGSKITWKYDSNKIAVEANALIAEKPKENLTDEDIKSIFTAAYIGQATTTGLFNSVNKEAPQVTVNTNNEGALITTKTIKNDQSIEVEYKLEQFDGKIKFTPTGFSSRQLDDKDKKIP